MEPQNNNQSMNTMMEKAPKFIEIIFKVYGAFILVVWGVLGILSISKIAMSAPQLLLSTPMFAVYGGLITYFIIAFGCWDLRRWVIPLLAVISVVNIIQAIISGPQIALLLSIIILILALVYRKYFTGTYKAIIIYIVFALATTLTFITLMQPQLLGGISDQEVNAYLESSEFDTAFRSVLEIQYGSSTTSFTQDQINQLKLEAEKDPNFIAQIRSMLEVQKTLK